MVSPARGTASLVALVALATLVGPSGAHAQTPTPSGFPSSPSVFSIPSRVSRAPATSLSLEGAVDPEAYIVGPGDVFSVSIGGRVPRQSTSTVSADGRLVIPESGSVQAAGRTLARVRADAQAGLQRQFQNVPVDVALAQPREFYVHVSGDVPSPGRHLVRAVARVEDAILEAADGSVTELARYGADLAVGSLEPVRWPALRNVQVTSRNGARTSVDLMRYRATGDLASNPYLLDGDAVYLPSFDPNVEGVVVDGAVNRPGTYDVRPADTALDLILVAAGSDATGRIAAVRRTRPGAGGAPQTVEVPIVEAGRLDVRARDQLYAVSSAPESRQAEVLGAVRFPGVYPITVGQTTLDQLVAMAGGLRDDALVRAAYLERPSRGGIVRDEPLPTAAADNAPPAATLTAGGTVPSDVAVETGVLGGLFSRQFYARQTEQTPRVSLNPEAALTGTEAVPLREGDRLVVPFDRGLVRVYGRVAQGGYLPYVAGATAGDYVTRAGGLSTGAAEVYVVDGATRQFAEGRQAPVRPGDAVFVNSLPAPDSPEFAQIALQERADDRADRQERRQATFQLIQTTLSVVGTVASLIIAYSSLSN